MKLIVMRKKVKFSKASFNRRLRAFFHSIPLYVSLVSSTIFGQATDPEAMVRTVTAETEDSIMIRASIPKTVFNRGDNIPISYIVTNKNKQAVYLVIEPHSNVLVENTSVLRLVQPVVGADDHLPFKYDLIRIPPQKTFSGELTIGAKYYLENKNYDFSTAEIQVGFSYLFDKSNLVGCKEATFVRPCLKELYDKSKSLTVGNLVIEIKP